MDKKGLLDAPYTDEKSLTWQIPFDDMSKQPISQDTLPQNNLTQNRQDEEQRDEEQRDEEQRDEKRRDEERRDEKRREQGYHKQTPPPLPKVTYQPPKGFQLVWLLPLIASLIGAWLAYKTLSEQGPKIIISFKTAEGLMAGKTRIKHKDVEIGKVKSVTLNEDLSGVLVTADLTKGTESYLTGNTKFWVVRPRLSLKGVSGLGTLVAGAHIEIEPAKGPPKTTFKGLEKPPVVRMDAPGGKYILQTKGLGSLDAGSPVYYRDIPAGEVLGYTLSSDQKKLDIHIFVRAPFHRLVRDSTQFWKISGINFSISAEGVQVKTESLHAMLMGGLTFETPETLKKSQPVHNGHLFWLYNDKNAITEQSYTQKIQFVLYFDGSVRGLNVGAPVEFRGIKVGKVTDIRMEFDPKNTSFRIPVLVQIEPQRVTEITEEEVNPNTNPYGLLDRLVESGLRAQLQTGSYLTGQLYVDLDIHPDAPLTLAKTNSIFPELPTVPNKMDEITASLTHLLKKFQDIPINAMADELHSTLKGANQTVNAPEVLNSLRSLQTTIDDLQTLINQINQQLPPLTTQVTEAAVVAQKTIVQAEKTLTSFDAILNPGAPLHYNLMEVTKELSLASRALHSFLQMLENKPEALLFGKERPQ